MEIYNVETVYDEKTFNDTLNTILKNFTSSLRTVYEFNSATIVRIFSIHLDETDKIIGYAIVEEFKDNHCYVDVNGYSIEGTKYWLTHFEIDKNYKSKKYGTRFLKYIRSFVKNDIYLLSVDSATLFYLKNGAYCLSDIEQCLETKSYLILPYTSLPVINKYFDCCEINEIIDTTKEVYQYLTNPESF